MPAASYSAMTVSRLLAGVLVMIVNLPPLAVSKRYQSTSRAGLIFPPPAASPMPSSAIGVAPPGGQGAIAAGGTLDHESMQRSSNCSHFPSDRDEPDRLRVRRPIPLSQSINKPPSDPEIPGLRRPSW